MKKKLLFIVFISLSTMPDLCAQWSTDPANPGIVCDVAGEQNGLQAFGDEEGGVYTFWLDKRNSISNGARYIYGQRYDKNGNALWEENGRLIIENYNRINSYNVKRFENGEIIIGWTTQSASYIYSDSLRIQRLDVNGNKIWSSDLLVGCAAPSQASILSVDDFHIIQDNQGYCIAIEVVYFGGSNGNRLTRFTSDGVLTGYLNGYPEGTQYYYGSSGLLQSFNASDDVYLYYSGGNGAGAGLFCLKINTNGDTVWGPVNVLQGTGGLSYQFSGISDPDGITFVWQGEGISTPNLYARRLNSDGTFAWGGVSEVICDADGNQGNFFWLKLGGYYYITWADGRTGTSPGYYDIMAQKFDLNGNMLWTANGIEVASLNTYIPFPEFAFSDSNSMIVCHQSTVAGFVAQKINDDGTRAWDDDGNQICTTTFNPFYAEHIEIKSGNNIIAVWNTAGSSGSDNIYITRIDHFDNTGHDEYIQPKLNISPNPANDHIDVTLPEKMNASVNIMNSSGIIVSSAIQPELIKGNNIRISTSGLPSGIYTLLLNNSRGAYTSRFIIAR